MFNRRELLVGGPILLGATFMGINGAKAGLLGKVGRVVGTVIQGANIITNPAKQIEIATHALTPLIHEVAPSADRGLEMIHTVAESSSSLEGRLKIIAATMAPQAIPFFVNTGFSDDDMRTYSQYSSNPLQLSSSDEQALLGDVVGYVNRHDDYLRDYVAQNSYGYTPKTFKMTSGGISLDGIPAGAVPKPGYYPSVVSINDLLNLVSIFRA